MYDVIDLLMAWGVGMFTGLFIVFMLVQVLPWLSGWRNITYHIRWTDENKRYQLSRQVKWRGDA